MSCTSGSWSRIAGLVALAVAGCGLSEYPRVPAPGPSPPAAGPNAPAPTADAGAATPGPAAPAPGPTGPGVTIDGRFVPRDKVMVFLHIGHSNMAGRATRPSDLRGFFYDTDPRLWIYGTDGFRPAKEPTAPDDGNEGEAGPGMALLRSALATATEGTHFVSIGHGHSGTYGGYCSSFRKGGLFYDLTMAPARALVGKVTFAGIFTMLGQSEYRFTPAQQEMLADCLKSVAADMRGDLGEPELPLLVGDYEAGITRSDIAPGSANGQRITAQLRMVPERVSRAAVVPTDGLTMQDDHHFDMAGHKGWAARAIEIVRARGWARWK